MAGLTDPSTIGTIASLHRFPIKSMAGEAIDAASLTPMGIPLDRGWAVRNLEAGEQQGARKLPALLSLAATLDADDVPIVRFPDGETLRADDPRASVILSEFLGKRVRLVPPHPATDRAHFRNGRLLIDAEALRGEMGVRPGEAGPDLSRLPFAKVAELGRYATPPGTYFDAYPIHLITSASLAHVRQASGLSIDARRYRPNLVVDTPELAGLPEADWDGASLRIGTATLRIEASTVRCSIPGRAQPTYGIEADKRVVAAVAKSAARHLGAYAIVTRPGRVRVGDEVRMVPARKSRLRRRLVDTRRTLMRRAYGRILGSK